MEKLFRTFILKACLHVQQSPSTIAFNSCVQLPTAVYTVSTFWLDFWLDPAHNVLSFFLRKNMDEELYLVTASAATVIAATLANKRKRERRVWVKCFLTG